MADQSLRYDVPGHRLICCICMEWTDFDDLAVDSDGTTWDMCKVCGALEAVAAIVGVMAGRTIRSLNDKESKQ